MFEGVMSALMVLLGVALLLAGWRLLSGPSMPDRVVALHMIMVQSVGLIALYSIVLGQSVVLDVAGGIVVAGFLGAVALARFMESERH